MIFLQIKQTTTKNYFIYVLILRYRFKKDQLYYIFVLNVITFFNKYNRICTDWTYTLYISKTWLKEKSSAQTKKLVMFNLTYLIRVVF